MSQLRNGVLFDLDGTLLDTAPEFTHCLNQILKTEGRDLVSISELRAHVSFGVRGMLIFGFQSELSEEAIEIHTEQFLTLYAAQLGSLTAPFPGIIELLSWLKDKNIPWGIVTNKPTRFAQPLLAQFAHLRDALCLITGDTLPVRKPDPAPLIVACTQLSLDPRQSWYIGDALADLEASRGAGLRCAIAEYGYFSPETDLLSWSADHIFKHPQDLIALWEPGC